MTWRLCFSSAPTRKLMTTPPANYNRSLYLGYLEDVSAKRIDSVWNAWSGPRPLPPDGTKFDINCNPRPLGFIWAGNRKDEYINATYARRQELLAELRDITLGLLWFQQNDDAVPAAQRCGLTHTRERFCELKLSVSESDSAGLLITAHSIGSTAFVGTSFCTTTTFHPNSMFVRPAGLLGCLGSRSVLSYLLCPMAGRLWRTMPWRSDRSRSTASHAQSAYRCEITDVSPFLHMHVP